MITQHKPNPAELLLVDYFQGTYRPIKRQEGVSGKTLYTMALAIQWLAASLGREPLLSDLNDAALSAMWAFMHKTHKRSPFTATWNVRRLVTIWRFAFGRLDVGGDAPDVKAIKITHSPWAKSAPPPWRASKRTMGSGKADSVPMPSGPATRETLLMEFLMQDYTHSHDVRPATVMAYRWSTVSLKKYLRRPAIIADLNPATINAWLAWLVGRSRSLYTAHSYRRSLLTLWRAAYELELADYPRRVRPIKRPERIIDGYDAEQMGRLLRTANALTGRFRKNRIDRNLWWVAFLLTAWSTGLRLGDLLSIERNSIRPDGDGFALSVVMSKTGRMVRRRLLAYTVEAIDRLMAVGPTRRICFPLWSDRRGYYQEFNALANEAGLEGTTKWIRRGSASEIEKANAGAGPKHLGHTSGDALFRTSYRVDRIVQTDIPLPPPPDFTPTLRIEHKAEGGAT